MKALIVMWLIVAFTPKGPVVGDFTDLPTCKVAKSYSEMQGYLTTECMPVPLPEMVKIGGWTVFLHIVYLDGSRNTLGFNSYDTCQEVRATYLERKDVKSISTCLVTM